MGQAIEVVSGYATNPGATITQLTSSPGNTFTPRSFATTDKAYLLNVWTENATGGLLRIRSPRMHDNQQGIRLQIPPADQVQLLPLQAWQQIYPVDPVIVEMTGGGAETDILSALYYYPNLPGVQANLAAWTDIQPRIVNLAGVEVDIPTGGAVGQYVGQTALNASFQNLKAGESYAILGYTVSKAFATLRITGPDTGNLGVAGPGSTNSWLTSGWFVDLNQALGVPTIPIVQANNAAGTILDVLDTTSAETRTVSLILAELSG